ncbi:aryl-sulfate sulfotransferase [Salmonella bongori]|nr:aryl-sulfate sulfotransferase [Salmonella bongori]EDP8659355.1 aryl-sulfate sulfotransferase [Salmonella bongori]
MYYVADSDVRINYTVHGKDSSGDFTYIGDAYYDCTKQIELPVIGLYPSWNNQVSVSFYDRENTLIATDDVFLSTREQIYRDDTVFNIPLTELTENALNTVWGNSWMVTSEFNGYDKNGDLRMYFAKPYSNEMLRIIDGYLYIGSHEDAAWYGRRFFKIDVLGRIIFEFDLADADGNRYANTHEVIHDADGFVYMLATNNPNFSTNTAKQDASLLKYNNYTGEIVWNRNYSQDFMGTSVIANGYTNDVHLNSLSYIPELNQIVVHSRACSTTFGVSLENGDILWTINSPYNPNFGGSVPHLSYPTDDIFEYENGAHTVFLTTNEAFSQYTDLANGKFVLSMLNNKASLDAQGNPVVRQMEAPVGTETWESTPLDVLYYVVDLQDKNVRQVAKYSFGDDQVTQWMGGVFEYGNYYTLFTNESKCFFVFTPAGEVLIEARDTLASGAQSYRARSLSQDELTNLIAAAQR